MIFPNINLPPQDFNPFKIDFESQIIQEAAGKIATDPAKRKFEPKPNPRARESISAKTIKLKMPENLSVELENDINNFILDFKKTEGFEDLVHIIFHSEYGLFLNRIEFTQNKELTDYQKIKFVKFVQELRVYIFEIKKTNQQDNSNESILDKAPTTGV
jgi:hypothetical protein